MFEVLSGFSVFEVFFGLSEGVSGSDVGVVSGSEMGLGLSLYTPLLLLEENLSAFVS